MSLVISSGVVLRCVPLSGWAMTIDTTKRAAPDNDYFTILTTGAVNYDVDWGDGTSESNITSNNKVHAYATPGVYSVKIFANTGSAFRPYYNNNVEGDKIVTLEDSYLSFPFGGSLASAFYGANNVTSVSKYLDVSRITNFINTWHTCSGLTSFPLIDTSSGINFISTWRECSGLTSFPLINTSSGTIFNSAWASCPGLTSFPLIDTSRGTSFNGTWFACSGLTSFPLINTSSGTSFNNTWRDCSGLTSFPAGFFNSWTATPSNNCFVGTWLGCTSLTATSVENILNSINASGRSAPASGVDITIDYNVGSGTPSVATAITNLKSRGWTITLNGVAQ